MRWLIACAAITGAAFGCGAPVAIRSPGLIDSEPTELGDPVGALLRELELEIRASYDRRSLDAAAAATVIDPSVGLTEFGVAPDAVAVGAAAGQRWPVVDVDGRPATVVSRGLVLGMSADRTVGWSYDDVSLRLPICDWVASVPLRIAQVWIRDSERWTLVAEHIGYAPPKELALDPAVGAASVRMTTAIERQPESQAAYDVVAMAIAGDGDRRAWGDRNDTLVVWPAVSQVYKAGAIRNGPGLADSLGATAVALDGVRLALGPTRSVAIVSATLAATIPSSAGAARNPVEARLRGTFVVERVGADAGNDVWSVRMALVSTPITTRALVARMVGVTASVSSSGRVTTTCR